MSRLKSLLAKMDGWTRQDATDAIPPITLIARENARHYIRGEYGIRWKVASDASATSLSPLASSDCPDDYAMAERAAIQAECSLDGSESDDVPGFDDVVPVTMAQRRAILSRVYGWVYPQEQQS